MSNENQVRLNNIQGVFFKGLWLVIGYFAVDLHIRVKDIDKGFQELKLDYARDMSEMKLRVKMADEEMKRMRRERIYHYPTTEQDDQSERDR